MWGIAQTGERWMCKWRIDYFYCFHFPRARKKMLQWMEECTWNVHQNLVISQYSQSQQQMCHNPSAEKHYTQLTTSELYSEWACAAAPFLPCGIWKSVFFQMTLLMTKTSEQSAVCHLHADSACSLRRRRRQEQADMFKVLLRIKKIPSSFESERRFSGTKCYLHPNISVRSSRRYDMPRPLLLSSSYFLLQSS